MKKFTFILALIFMFMGCSSDPSKELANTSAPRQTVKLCFIHHSTGSDWLSKGGLGKALNDNNFYVTESDYTWDATLNDNLGDHTDTQDWPLWFNDEKMPYVYNNNSNFDHQNTIANPSGENSIIMFKSCYPLSQVGESIDDEKKIYNDLLSYFAAHNDKMFILVVPPPMISISNASLTRQLSNWLVDRNTGWLASYPYKNVYAFNYYNVLTDPNNHHYINALGAEVNIVSKNPVDSAHPNELYYHANGDNHPTALGQQKATKEFLPLLKLWYNTWQSSL